MGFKRFITHKVAKPVKRRYTGKKGLKHIWKDTKTAGNIGYKSYKGFTTGGFKGAATGAIKGVKQSRRQYNRGQRKTYPRKSSTYKPQYKKTYSPYKRSYSTPYKKSYYPRKTYSRGKDTVKIYMD